MKTSLYAFVLTLLLAYAGVLPADARPMGHFGTSSGLKSGFSSQKGNAFRSARTGEAMAAPKNAPGAFGAAAGASSAAGAAKGASPLSRDLDQSAAQANATKTLEARRAASAVPPASTVPPQADPLRPQPAPGAYYQQMPQPIYVQRHDSGWMPMWMGFMLGRSLSGGHQTVYYANNNGAAYVDPNNGGNNGNAGGGNIGDDASNASNASGAAANAANNSGHGGEDWDRINPVGTSVGASSAATVAAPAVPPHSFGNAVLRALAWLAFLSTMFWVLRVIFKRMLRHRAAANYSFERN